MNFLTATADSEGRYEIKGVTAGSYSASISADGKVGPYGLGGVTLTVEIPEGPEFQHDFSLPQIYLTGKVLKEGTEEPLRGVYVQAVIEGGAVAAGGRQGLAGMGNALTEADGTFKIALASAGTYKLQASKAGFAPAAPQDVQVSESGSSDVEIHLSSGNRILGRVVDESGRPVPEAFVWSDLSGPGGNTATDDAGHFILEVTEGSSPDLRIFARGRAPAFLESVHPGDDEMLVHVTPGGELDLQVNAPPALRPKLDISLLDSKGENIFPIVAGFGMMTGGVENDLKGSGKVVFKHLAPGSYTVSVHGGGQNSSTPVTIEEGKPVQTVVDFQ